MARATDSNGNGLCYWAELTEYEQREAAFRGFPRNGGIVYRVRPSYNQDRGELSLAGFARATRSN